MPTIIIAAFMSVAGLLGAFLYLEQSHTTNTQADAVRAEQRCDQAKFDNRFDGALSPVSPASAAESAKHIAHVCAEAKAARGKAAQAESGQESAVGKLREDLAHALDGK